MWKILFLFHQPHLVLPKEKYYVLRISYEVLFVSILGLVLSESWKRLLSWGCASLFLFSLLQKSERKFTEFFRLSKDYDHQNIKIVIFYILYQTFLSQDSKNNLFFIGMSFEHENMFIWNASILVCGPCILMQCTKCSN